MSVKKFIESGIIESYVLGLCTPEELKQVKAMKAKHPTVREEIKAVRNTLLVYALKHEVKPPDDLKDKILSAAKAVKKKTEVKAAEKKGAEKPPAVKPPEEKVAEPKPVEEKPHLEKTAGLKPGTEKTEEIKPAPEKPHEEKAAEVKPPHVKPLEAKAPEVKTTDVKKQTEFPSARKAESRGFTKPYLIAASLALLLISAYYNYFLWNKLQKNKMDLSALKSEKDWGAQQLNIETTSLKSQLAEKQASLDSQTARAEAAQKDLAVLLHSFRTITLTSEEAAGITGKQLYAGGAATVYWNEASNETFIRVQNLPPTDTQHQYQLWALADGKPADAGVLDISSNIRQVKNVKAAQLFAITLEVRGGSPKPTLSAMYLAGKI